MHIEFSEMKKSPMTLLPFLYLQFSLLIILSITSSTTTTCAASPLKTPRLRSVLHETFTRGRPSNTIPASAPEGFVTSFYPQTLDHFNYQPQSYIIFQQRYLINYTYWGGAKQSAPIFVYLGHEAPLDEQVGAVGFLLENAPHFKALVLYIEHRFYGQSIPFGNFDEAMNDANVRGYFNSAQALADYAELIIHLKKKLSAHNSPVIVVGGSYGGMLAAWFRLKYPHVALGALASSAPILYIDKIAPYDGFNLVVQKDFRETSENCYETIRKSWSEIDRVASEPNGLSILSQKFQTCSTLSSAADLVNFLIGDLYQVAAQYDSPTLGYPVTQICGGIDGAKQGTDILGKIFLGLVALTGNLTCYPINSVNTPYDETSKGWGWQTCSELIMPTFYRTNATMFPPFPFNFAKYSFDCLSNYGVSPRPHWVTTYYGGHDIKLVLRRFGSNIIFSNGLRDPYSSGGVLEDLSDTLRAVYTTQGSHCLDIQMADETDPKWLIQQRTEEVKIIKGWLKKYYADLHALA